MRKYFLLIVLSILISSCAKEVSVTVDECKSNFEFFDFYGKVHNELLKYASDNFIETKAVKTQQEGVDYMLRLQQYGADRLNISEKNKKALKVGMEYFKDMYITDNIHKMISVKTRIVEENEEVTTNDIKQLIYEAYIANEIDEFEYTSFNELIEYVVANAEGLIGVNEFENKINSLIRSWEVKYADVDFSTLATLERPNIEKDELSLEDSIIFLPPGSLSGTVLSVSKSSVEYWKNEDVLNETKAIPYFVGADIAGAIIGACATGTIQYLRTKELDGEGLLYAAASGAIVGSTGIVGKFGSWITKLMNSVM